MSCHQPRLPLHPPPFSSLLPFISFFFSARCRSMLEADQTTPDARRVFSSVTGLQEDRMLAPFPGQQGREAGSTPGCAKGQKGTGPTRGTGVVARCGHCPMELACPQEHPASLSQVFLSGVPKPLKKIPEMSAASHSLLSQVFDWRQEEHIVQQPDL